MRSLCGGFALVVNFKDKTMNIDFDENWLSWAIQIEDAADCDISAGLDYGQNLGKYLELVENLESNDNART
jgi:hypothetical protein